jgi:DNA primase
MEKWAAGGIQLPDDAAQTQAALGRLEQASRAIRESRAQLDRLYSRLSELQTTGRSFPRTGGQGTATSAPEFWAEIRALVPEADAVLNTVTTRIGEAAEALSGVPSAADHRLGQAQAPTTARPRSTEPDTPDEITRRDDVRHRY